MTHAQDLPVALVTAGLHGIGHAIATALRDHGYRVAVTTTQCTAAYDSAAYVVVPVALDDYDAWAAWVAATYARWQRIDVLVNNLGPYLFHRPSITATSLDEWRQVLDGNTTIAWWLSKQVIPYMRQRQFGRIVNIGCIGSHRADGWAGRAAFIAAKSALASLTRSINLEYGSDGITATLIEPAKIPADRKECDGPSVEPTGGDVARWVITLADPALRFAHGAIIPIGEQSAAWRAQVQAKTQDILSAPASGTSVWIERWQQHGIVEHTRLTDHGQWEVFVRPTVGPAEWMSIYDLSSPRD